MENQYYESDLASEVYDCLFKNTNTQTITWDM
jgi:hypothetical protein